MAWEIVQRMDGNRSAEAVIGQPATASQTWRLVAEAGDFSQDEITAVSAPGLPVLGEAHPSNPFMTVRRIRTAAAGDDGRSFTAEVEYSNAAEAFEENPLLRPPQFLWLPPVKSQKVADRDRHGQRITASSGEPFDPPLMVEESAPAFGVRQNVLSYNAAAVLISFQDAINSAPFYGFPAYTVRCDAVAPGEPKVESGVFFIEVTAYFLVKFNTWRLRVLDQGFYKIDGGERVNIVDKNGMPLSRPALLNGSGGVLNPGQHEEYLEFEYYREVNFNGIF